MPKSGPVQVSSKPHGPQVKWTLDQTALIKTLPAKRGSWARNTLAYRLQVEELAQRLPFKSMNIPAFKIHNRAVHVNFKQPAARAAGKAALDKKAVMAASKLDARVQAAVAEALTSRVASSAAGGSAANAIDVN